MLSSLLIAMKLSPRVVGLLRNFRCRRIVYWNQRSLLQLVDSLRGGLQRL